MKSPVTHDGKTVREMTANEYAEYQQLSEEIEARNLSVVFAKESAKAKLAALGLTEAEVNAIIGGV